MDILKHKLSSLKRKLLAKYLRSNVISMLTWCAVGIFISGFAVFWAIGSVNQVREEKGRSDYVALKLVESQVNTIFRSQFSQLGMVSTQVSNSLSQFSTIPTSQIDSVLHSNIEIWLPKAQSNDLVQQGKESSHDLGLQKFVDKTWRRFNDIKDFKSQPTSVFKLADMSLSNGGRSLAFVVPIISSNGKFKGVITSDIPVSKIQAYLPTNTYLIDATSTAFIGKEGTDIESMKTRDSRDAVLSMAVKVPISETVASWKIRADHSPEELWSSPGIREILNFNLGLFTMIWGSVYFLVRSGNSTRNRQRMLIGSLVQKIIFITTEDGHVDYVLGKIGDHLGWKEVDYLDVEIGLFVHPDDRPLIAQAIANAQSSIAKDEILEIRFENKDREFRWYEVTITNMIKVPEINGIVITAHDIEQRMSATAHILASKRAAEKANEAKSEFLSRMSHELRTPLNAILGFGQLLEMEAITDRQAENVDQILIAGRHLLGLVNDILDIARIETRKVNLSVERVNIREVIEESFALLAPLSNKSHVTLTFEETECPDIWSDRQRLKQVFLNLLSNGIKYNQENGSVQVSIVRCDQGLRILFVDNGIGIEPQYIDRVFTPFDRLGSDNGQVEGSGLGLALSKTLIDAMGAKMEVRSEFGKGSTFSLFFPNSSIAKPALEVIEQDDLSDGTGFENPNNLRVLLIEDNIVNLRYITKFAEKLEGVALISAKEGGIGIEMARLHLPDLILLDLDLPDINGQEVLVALRADECLANTHIVVMSAETNPHIVEQTLALGAHKFVTKPVDVGSLFMLFDEEKKAA